MFKRRVTGIGLLVLVIFGCGLFVGGFFHALNARRAPHAYNTAVILQQIQTLSELVTVKYVLEKIEVQEEPPDDWFRPWLPFRETLTWNRVILIAHGVVKAGVDLSQLKPGDVTIAGNRLSVRLPAAKVTDAYLDEKKTQVVEHTTGLLRAFNKDLEQTTRQNALDDIRRAARSSGILKDADERARSQLTHLVQQMGFEGVEFRGQ